MHRPLALGLLSIAIVACQGHPSATPCTVLCSADLACPASMACADDGYCHSFDDADDCMPPESPDAAPVATPDAPPMPPPPDAPPAVVFQCPADTAVSAISVDGRPTCFPLGPDGLLPAWSGNNQYTCPLGYTVTSQYFPASGSTNETTLYACFLDAAGVGGSDPSYRHPFLGSLTCPRGTTLRGFAPNGAAICRADATVPTGYGISVYQVSGVNTCPPGYQMNSHHTDTQNDWNATWKVCERGSSDAALETALPGPFAAGGLGGAMLCPSTDPVTGFHDDGSPVCGPAYSGGIPAGGAFHPTWNVTSPIDDSEWRSNSYSCPSSSSIMWLEYSCGCNRNARWPGCY